MTFNFGTPANPQTLTLPDGSQLNIQKRSIQFRLWSPLRKRWRKPVLDFMGDQVCAETAVVRLLTAEGWEAVWVSSNLYRRDFPPHRCTITPEAELQLHRIRGKKLTGCWDVFAFKNGTSLFVECKRKSKDSIKPSQCAWLSDALKLGHSPENFLILEWTTET